MNSIGKVTIITALLLFVGVVGAWAVPAKGGVVKALQRDGVAIDIERHGDEFFRYTTTSDGYLISQHEGLYYYADISSAGRISRTTQRASNSSGRGTTERAFLSSRSQARNMAELRVAQTTLTRARRAEMAEESEAMQSMSLVSSAELTTLTRSSGDVRGLVIMVNFADNEFTYAQSDFYSMLNDEDYSANSGTGSARDFFIDNSMGTFIPTFDVVGPYTLSEDMDYYGGNNDSGSDSNPRIMVTEACELAEAGGVDYSLYDHDDDGYVDMVFIFYAGYNEAEGADEDTIWPHMWSIASSSLSSPAYDGKKIWTYACTSELMGSGSSSNPRQEASAELAGIGTFTHEYGHTLGLYDTYDVDYEENGYSSGLYTFDIMSRGSYNNDGRTPPYYGALHRYQLGWITPKSISSAAEYELQSIANNEAYIVNTDVEDEYYLFEYRNATLSGMREWDNYISYTSSSSSLSYTNGLFITHIDKSMSVAAGGYTASDLWLVNKPNSYLSHECARVVYSDANVTTVDSFPSFLSMLFPGILGNDSFGPTTSPAAKSWSGASLSIDLTNIRVEDGVLKFTNHESLIDNSSDDEADDDSADDVIVDDSDSVEIYGDGYPFVVLNTNSLGEDYYTITPVVRNASEYDSLEWYLNGEAIAASTTQILSTGSYSLVCVLTIGEQQERIIKEFEL